MCNVAQWSNPSWTQGQVPGLTATGAPWKDTVILPPGGYVVIRFLADNPGMQSRNQEISDNDNFFCCYGYRLL